MILIADINKLLAAAEEVPLNYSAEFCEFSEIIMINKELEIPVNATNELNLYFFT